MATSHDQKSAPMKDAADAVESQAMSPTKPPWVHARSASDPEALTPKWK